MITVVTTTPDGLLPGDTIEVGHPGLVGTIVQSVKVRNTTATVEVDALPGWRERTVRMTDTFEVLRDMPVLDHPEHGPVQVTGVHHDRAGTLVSYRTPLGYESSRDTTRWPEAAHLAAAR